MHTNSKKFNEYMLGANIGLEKECLRINADGNLATSLHPFPGDEHIDRDFSENQLEFITGIYDTPASVYEEMFRLHQKATHTLLHLPSGAEYMWPFSNPPAIDPAYVNAVASFDGDSAWKTDYRNHLRREYGTRLMMYSGIHFNFSFKDEFFEAMFPGTDAATLLSLRDAEYLNLSAWTMRYAWLIVYLLSASSVIDESFFGKEGFQAKKEIISSSDIPVSSECLRYSSPRTSRIGYWNKFEPVLDFSSLENYVDSIVSYVKDGRLLIPAELYYPVRLKPRGRYDMDALKQDGVSHIEIRIVDLNPYSPVGIFREDIQFLHLLLVYLMYKVEAPFTEKEQLDAIHNIKNAALYEVTPLASGASMREEAHSIIREMDAFYRKGAFTRVERDYIRETLSYQLSKLEPGNRYAERVRRDFGESYMDKGIALAEAHAKLLG